MTAATAARELYASLDKSGTRGLVSVGVGAGDVLIVYLSAAAPELLSIQEFRKFKVTCKRVGRPRPATAT